MRGISIVGLGLFPVLAAGLAGCGDTTPRPPPIMPAISASQPASLPATSAVTRQEERAAKLAAELKQAKDPVAVALEYVADREDFSAPIAWPTKASGAAIDVLKEHWQDIRGDKALEDLSKVGPWSFGRCHESTSLAGFAGQALVEIRCRRQHRDLLAGADTPEDQLVRIRRLFEENPKLLSRHERPGDQQLFVELVVETARKIGGPKVADLVCQSCMAGKDDRYHEKYATEMAEYAGKMGYKRVLATSDLLEILVYDEQGKLLAILQEWLAKAETDADLQRLTWKLCVGPGGKERSLALSKDPRPAVARYAAMMFENWYAKPAMQPAMTDEQAISAFVEILRKKFPADWDISIEGPRRINVDLWNWDQNPWPGYSLIFRSTGPNASSVLYLFVLDKGYSGKRKPREVPTQPSYEAREFTTWRGRMILSSGGGGGGGNGGIGDYWPNATPDILAALKATDETAATQSATNASGPASQSAQWHKSSAGLESRMETQVWNNGEAIRFIVFVRNSTDKDIKAGGFMYDGFVTLDGTAFHFAPRPIVRAADGTVIEPDDIKAGWTGEFGTWYYPIKDSFKDRCQALEGRDANGKWFKPNLKPGRHTAAFELGPIQTGTIEFDLPTPATQPAGVNDAEAAARVKAASEIAARGESHIEFILVELDKSGKPRTRTFSVSGGYGSPQPPPDVYWLQNENEKAKSLVNILAESGFFKCARAFDMADRQYSRPAAVVRFHTGEGFYEEIMPWDGRAKELLGKMHLFLVRKGDSQFGKFLDKANWGPTGPCVLEKMTELARQINELIPPELALFESGRSDAPHGWSGETRCEYLSFCMAKNKKFSVIQLWLTPADFVSRRYMFFARQSVGSSLKFVKDNPDGRLMFVSRIPFGPEDEAWKKFEKKILELSFAPTSTHDVTPAAEKFRRAVTTAPAGNDRLPGSLVGLDKAVVFPDFILAAVCLAKNDAEAVAGEASQNFEIVEVLDGVDKAGRGYPINYRFDDSPKFKERAILKGEQVIWIVRLSESNCYNGILALPDTPENRKAVREGVAKSGHGITSIHMGIPDRPASAPATQPATTPGTSFSPVESPVKLIVRNVDGSLQIRIKPRLYASELGCTMVETIHGSTSQMYYILQFTIDNRKYWTIWNVHWGGRTMPELDPRREYDFLVKPSEPAKSGENIPCEVINVSQDGKVLFGATSASAPTTQPKQ